MPTENPRVTITMSEEQLEEIKDYLHENKLKNQTQAILSLINKGFEAINVGCADAAVQANKITPTKTASVIENKLTENFRKLNKDGQDMLYELSNAMVDSKRYKQTIQIAARGSKTMDASKLDSKTDLSGGVITEDL